MALTNILNCLGLKFPDGDGAKILQATVILTDAQIKALPTTPVTIVAAPGAGIVIRPIGAMLSTNTSAGAYTNIDAAYSAIYLDINGEGTSSFYIFDDNSVTPDPAQVTGIFGAAGRVSMPLMTPNAVGINNAAVNGTEWIFTQYNASANVENKALRIAADNNGTGNFTGGNAANRLRVTVYYALETVQP